MPKILLPIPKDSKINVAVGDKVKRGDPLAVGKRQGKLQTLELAALLGTKPQEIKKLLVPAVGSRVERGELLAKKESLLGLSKTLIFSPISGKIELLDEKSGKLFIREKDDAFPIHSKLTGEVSRIREDGIEIETQNEVFFGKEGFGSEVEGELLSPSSRDKMVLDKIILVEKLGRLSLAKAFGLGARGVVTTTISEQDRVYTKEREFQLAYLLVAKDDFQNLKDYLGRQVLLFPEEKMLVVT